MRSKKRIPIRQKGMYWVPKRLDAAEVGKSSEIVLEDGKRRGRAGHRVVHLSHTKLNRYRDSARAMTLMLAPSGINCSSAPTSSGRGFQVLASCREYPASRRRATRSAKLLCSSACT